MARRFVDAPQKESRAPKEGDVMTVRGLACRIFKVRPCGTVDVVSLDGEHVYRVSGLGFAA